MDSVTTPLKKDTHIEYDAKALQSALTRFLRVYRYRDREIVCCYDVSAEQCHAIEQLVASGPATLNEFSASLYLEKSSASRLIDGLEKKGYVRRDPNPDDGRSLLLRLTAEGSNLAQRLESDLLAERQLVLENFDPDEREVVVRAIEKLADQAEACCSTEMTGGGVC